MTKIKNTFFAVVAILLLASCGRDPVQIQVEEPLPRNQFEEGVAGIILNAVAGTVQKVIGEKSEGLSPVVMAHALPKGTEPFAMEKCEERSEVFQKQAKSPLGFNLAKVKYKISYLSGCRYKGKGHYLANVAFTPIEVETDPLYSLAATAVSEAAINKGTAKAPIASVKFVITFTVSGIGSKSVTDEFVLEAKEGILQSKLGQF